MTIHSTVCKGCNVLFMNMSRFMKRCASAELDLVIPSAVLYIALRHRQIIQQHFSQISQLRGIYVYELFRIQQNIQWSAGSKLTTGYQV